MSSGKLFLLLLVFCTGTVVKAARNPLFDSANAAYAKGDFEKAARHYESLAARGLEAPELYYNLGNAWFRQGENGKAIVNYERALKLAPDDEDILFNLQLANQRTEDKIEAAPEMFLSQWRNSITGLMSEDAFALTCIISFGGGLALLLLYVMSGKKVLRKIGFFGGGICLLLALASFMSASAQRTDASKNNEAIILAGSVTVTGSPSDSGTRLFLLHEGTKVRVMQEKEEWSEIRIANGNVGWVKSTQLEKI